MSAALTLLLLAAGVAGAAPLCRLTGRAAGYPLAALYLVAAAVFAPAVSAVAAGERPAWSTPWVPGLGVDLALRVDGLGVVFTLIALLVGAAVLAYSARYLERGPNTGFYVVMAAFTLSMVGLVLADDLLLLFVCWELTSIASFLLVARSGRDAEGPSMRTLLLTYLGGLTLLAAVAAIVAHTGTTSVTEALAHPVWGDDPAFTTLVAVLVLVAGFSKSAQFPFHVWLPDAMAAATPVSAYLHAAAVVKAGIFLLMRFSPAFADNPVWNVALIGVGLLTGAIGAWFALQQTDLKTLMAYSTVSQLGLVVATIGVGTGPALVAAVAHTISHALFKSGLFMMIGVVDHATGTRDVRSLPRLSRRMPGSLVVTALGAASMAGLPPMLGFVSKEGILAAMREAPGGAAAGWAALAGAAAVSVLTFAYCGKIVFSGFVDGRGDDTYRGQVHPVGAGLVLPAALPIVAGLPLGVAPAVLDAPVEWAAEAAVPAHEPHAHLALWHGITPELVATLVVFALGALFLARRRVLVPRLERSTFSRDGADVIAAIDDRLAALGVAGDGAVGTDRPSRHLAPLLLAFAAVVVGGGATLALGAPGAVPPVTPGAGRLLDVVLLGLILVAVVTVCRSMSRLAATVALSGVGILATVQILTLGAPDVALTQLLVESLTVIIIMLVLQKLPRRFATPSAARVRGAGAVAVAAGLAAGLGTFLFTGRRERSEIADYLLRNTYEISGGANVVNVILVEFRALDTLGELTVLGMAGAAIVAVVSTLRRGDLDPPADGPVAADAADPEAPGRPRLRRPGSTAHRAITEAWPNALPLQLVLRFLAPLLALVSGVIFFRGHNEPGGGFIAALVGAAIVALLYLSTSRDRRIGAPWLPLVLIGGGVATAVLTGLWGMAAAGSFLEPLHTEVGPVHLTTSLLFDVGVYAAVLGLVMVAVGVLGASGAPDDEAGADTPGAGPARRVGVRTRHLADGVPPKEVGR